jgi:sulfide:quinone oxidoreductase
MADFAVVICGAGIAGIEGLLRLRRLVGDRVDVTVLSPDVDLVLRPLSVLEPFAMGSPSRYSIQQITSDIGATWVRDELGWVDRERQVAHTAAGQQLRYDALLLAVGGREVPWSEDVTMFNGRDSVSVYGSILDEVDAGDLGSLAFVVPDGPLWPLPLYELALLTAQRARASATPLEISFVVAESGPLQVFGDEASQAVRVLLQQAGMALYSSCHPQILNARHMVLQPNGIHLHPNRIVSLPMITGPNIRGIPGFARDRFLHVDERCRVKGTDGRIFAAGDATDLAVKQGGVGAQQADTAAAGIAHLAGLAAAPEPLRPVIRGTLLTGGSPLYLTAHLVAGRGWRAEISEQPPWPANEKVIAEELGAYLGTRKPTAS